MHMYLDILNAALAEISKCCVDVYKAEAAQLTEADPRTGVTTTKVNDKNLQMKRRS